MAKHDDGGALADELEAENARLRETVRLAERAVEATVTAWAADVRARCANGPDDVRATLAAFNAADARRAAAVAAYEDAYNEARKGDTEDPSHG